MNLVAERSEESTATARTERPVNKQPATNKKLSPLRVSSSASLIQW
jgi:hypothetical protein